MTDDAFFTELSAKIRHPENYPAPDIPNRPLPDFQRETKRDKIARLTADITFHKSFIAQIDSISRRSPDLSEDVADALASSRQALQDCQDELRRIIHG